MARKIVFGVIIFLFVIRTILSAAGHAGEPVRLDLALAQLLVLIIPVRSVRPDGTRLYSAMLYRMISIQTDSGKRERKVQFYPKNFEPWEKQKK